MPPKCSLKLSQEAMQSAANSTVHQHKLEGIGKRRGSVPGLAVKLRYLQPETLASKFFQGDIPALSLAR